MNKNLTIISGPCSAESRQQILTTAFQLKQIGINLFRAGIWKPRTRPGSFEGVGEKGLEWLQEVQEEYGLQVLTEVAQPEHVDLCLKYGINTMWIGARTTANPFSMTKLADSLNNPHITVGIKNPISPDLDLWIGAIERIQQTDAKKVFVIHRGFYQNSDSKYRNDPIWKIPLKIKKIFPELKILCDPSHICGNRKLIPQIAQQAIDLQFDGLMIESHINPSKALTDVKQQLTPSQLRETFDNLVRKAVTSIDKQYTATIQQMRAIIDTVDNEVIDLLVKRMKIVEVIGRSKKEQQVATLQPNRWADVLEKRIDYGSDLGLSDKFITEVFETIHEEALKRQTQLN